MKSALELEGGRLAIQKIGNGSALQYELVVSAKAERWREIDTTGEPRLYLVHAAAFDFNRPLCVQHAQVVVDGFGKQALCSRVLAPTEQDGRGQRSTCRERREAAGDARSTKAARL